MKKVRKWKKGTALLLAALLSIPVYAVNPLPANAAEREVRTVNINIDNDLGIKNPEIPQNDTDEWKGGQGGLRSRLLHNRKSHYLQSVGQKDFGFRGSWSNDHVS